jgi:hypothetical protein
MVQSRMQSLLCGVKNPSSIIPEYYSRGAAARVWRSLMAMPRLWVGIGITAIRVFVTVMQKVPLSKPLKFHDKSHRKSVTP